MAAETAVVRQGVLSGNAGPRGTQNLRKSLLRRGARNLKGFDLVRLRIYYDPSCPVMPANGIAQAVSLTRLVVVRESGRASLLPDMLEIISDTKAESAGRITEHVVAKTCQAWNATNETGFVWNLPRVASLQRNLRRMFLGHPVDQASGELAVEDIPVDSLHRHLDPVMECVEVIGIIDGNISTGADVACLGFKTLICDDFCRIVISALDELIP